MTKMREFSVGSFSDMGCFNTEKGGLCVTDDKNYGTLGLRVKSPQ